MTTFGPESFYDSHAKRNIVPCNTKEVSGIKLEDIPETSPGYAPGLAVVLRAWPYDIFLMKKHEGLSNDEIFQICDGLLKEKGIKPGERKDLVD